MKNFRCIPDSILNFAEEGALFESLLPAVLFRGDDNSPVAFLYGPNGAGKSFFMRIIATLAKKAGYEPIMVSMSMRTKEGFHRAFMYSPFGDQRESTGLNSFIAVKGGLRTICGEDRKAMLILDEPDVGLSDGYAEAMGEWLAEKVEELHENSAGVLLCTHSKALVRRYLECCKSKPHGIHLHDGRVEKALPVQEWVDSRESFSAADLEGLGELLRGKRRAIDAFLEK